MFDLIKYIKRRNNIYYKNLCYIKHSGYNFIEKNGVTELQIHKLLYFLYGYFYQKYKKELFHPVFFAFRYGPVEQEYRLNKKLMTKDELNGDEIAFLNKLTDALLSYSVYALVQKSYSTKPWLDYFTEDKYSEQIPSKAIQEYFLSLNED